MTSKWQIIRDCYNLAAAREITTGRQMEDKPFWKHVLMRYEQRIARNRKQKERDKSFFG